MPLGTAAQLQTLILQISDPPGGVFPATQPECVQAWVDVADALFQGVIPPSLTASAARAAFIGILSAATPQNPIGAVLLDAAFAAYAGIIAGGMAPLYVGTPPIGLPMLSAILVAPVPDALPVAIAMSAALSIWSHTGLATMVAPPFTVLPWV